MSVLYYLQSLRTPFWDTAMSLLTQIAETTVLMVIGMIALWCIDKKWGYRLLFLSIAANLVNQVLKVIWKSPRPWVVDPNFQIIESAREAASGYSFPSGHTMSATCMLGGIALWFKKWWVTVLCLSLTLVVAFSRLYLGVHMPEDAIVGWLVSVAVVAVLGICWKKWDDSVKLPWVLGIAVAVGFVVLMLLLYLLPEVDAEFDQQSIKNGWVLVGSGTGLLIARYVDAKWTHYDTKAVWWAQILKCALGGAILLGVRAALKAPLTALVGEGLGSGIRYFCMVIVGTVFWPMTFKWFGRLGKKKTQSGEKAA